VPLQCNADDTFGTVRAALVGAAAGSLSSADLWFEHRGRSWGNDVTLREAGVAAGTVLTVHSRLRGGGGDGGSTGAESRSCYLEMYAGKKAGRVNPLEAKLAKWTRCHLSGELLQQPVVADELGSLYNKDAVVQALLTRSLPASLSHISSLKHLINLKLTPNSSATGQSKAASQGNFQPGNEAHFACPVTGLEFNGRFPFVVLRKSGLVVSEKALKMARAAVEEMAGGPWQPEDVLPINGTAEQIEEFRGAMLAKRAAAKAKKLNGKNGKSHTKTAVDAVPSSSGGPADAGVTEAEQLQVAANAAEARRNVTSATAAADLLAAVAAAGAKRAATDEGAVNGCDVLQQSHGAKRYKASERLPQGASKDVYASIFLSSRKQEEKETYLCRATSARGMHLT
jgi:hypothetical protein